MCAWLSVEIVLEDYFVKIYWMFQMSNPNILYFAQIKLVDAKGVGRLFKINKLGNLIFVWPCIISTTT